MTPRHRSLSGLALLIVVACAAGAGCLSGCVNPFAPAGGSGVQPGTPIQQQQRAVDAAKERYGLAMDVLTPLVERGVIADADVLRIIRVSVKQIDADLKDAQARLSAGQLLTAEFLTDRILGAVVTLERIRDRNKGAGK
jgi:hypothetical protein